MNLSCSRHWRHYSAKRLRRARRLYARITFEGCVGHLQTALVTVARAQQAGLYASATGAKDVFFSMCRHWWHLDLQTNPGIALDFWFWMERFMGMPLHNYHSKQLRLALRKAAVLAQRKPHGKK